MSETSEAAAEGVLVRPLPESELGPGAAKLLAGPTPMKLMAARGIAPLRPAELALVVYQLSFEGDPAIRAAAEGAPSVLPDTILVPLLREPLPGQVIHFFATRLPEHRGAAIEAVLYNPNALDETFVLLGKRLFGDLLEILCQNEARLLRCPAIVKSLFENPGTRMSSVNRAIELCARNGVEVDIPGYDEIVRAIRDDPEATSGARDAVFEDLAKVAVPDDVLVEIPKDDSVLDDELREALAKAEAAEISEAAAEAEKEAALASAEKKRKSIIIDFSRLKIFEKVRLATFGNEYCRFNLIRDPNRLVAMAVVRSPKITDKEIIAAASSRSVHGDVIRYIANSREALKKYTVRLGLVNNPKCPQQTALRLLTTLQTSDIKKLARSKNVPAAIATTARRMLDRRGAG